MRTATPADAPRLRSLLAHAYAADPLLEWIFPDPVARLEATAAWLGTYVERYLAVVERPAGGVWVIETDGVLAGAAIWRWPTDEVGALGRGLPTSAGLLAALIGTARAATVVAGMAAEREIRPPGPHAYLHFLAVDADHRGHGHGRALVEEGVARATSSGLPVLLETTNPENVGFYARLGFRVAAAVELGADGPALRVMTSGAPVAAVG